MQQALIALHDARTPLPGPVDLADGDLIEAVQRGVAAAHLHDLGSLNTTAMGARRGSARTSGQAAAFRPARRPSSEASCWMAWRPVTSPARNTGCPWTCNVAGS